MPRPARVPRLRLHRAAAHAELAWVRDLLARDPQLASSLDDQLRTPLHWAADGGDAYRDSLLTTFPTTRAAIAGLLAAAAPHLACAIDCQGRTPLHRAARCGNEAVVRLLIAAAPQAVTMPDFAGCTPLHAAASCPGASASVAALLAVAPWMALQADSDGATPLHLAAEHDEESACLLLAEAPAAVCMPCNHSWRHRGWTALHAAVYRGRVGLARLMLEVVPHAAGVADQNGDMALHWAAQHGKSQELLELLLQAAPSAALHPDSDGDTPLHCAAIGGNAEAVAALLAAAPSAAQLRNKSAKVPLQLALGTAARWASTFDSGMLCARHLLAVGPGSYLVSALAGVEDSAGALALQLYPQLAATHALTAADWAQLPDECPGLQASLPVVLARSEAEAACLVAHLPAVVRQQVQAGMLCLARQQGEVRVPLPVPALRHILSMCFA